MNELEMSNLLRILIYIFSFIGVFVIGIYINKLLERDNKEADNNG